MPFVSKEGNVPEPPERKSSGGVFGAIILAVIFILGMLMCANGDFNVN